MKRANSNVDRIAATALIVCSSILLPIGLTAQSDAPNQAFIAQRVDARIMVADPDAVSKLLADFADERGGYFVTKSETLVTLRLPGEGLDDFRDLVYRVADETIRFDPSSLDLRLSLIRVEAGITSRTEALDQILIYLADADIEATLAFELELRAINGELETLIGQKRRLEHDIEYSFITVALSSTESEIPVHRPSSFDWINRVDLYYFLSGAGW